MLQNFITEKGWSMMITYNIGENGTADIMKDVINSLKNKLTTLGDFHPLQTFSSLFYIILFTYRNTNFLFN